MTFWDLVYKTTDPYINYAVGLLLLWAVLKITDTSLTSLIQGTLGEVKSILEGKFNLKAVNAMGVILLFFLVIFLFHGKLNELILPEKKDLAHDGIYAFVFVYFGLVLMGSLHISKSGR